jgi:TIGR03009 family protein
MRRLTTVLASSVLVLGSTTWLAEADAQGVREGTKPLRNPARVRDRAATPAEARAAAEQEPFDPKMDELLRLWERQSRKLKSLDVMIYRRDIDGRAVLGGEEHYQGTAKFESPNRAYIEFNLIKLDRKKKPVIDPKTRRRVTERYEVIKCTGSEVWQYKFDTKQIFVYPLSKEEQARALDEGPLPFLFNMNADDARNRYHMTLLPEKENAKVHLVEVTPKLAIDREDFGKALIELEKQYLLPTRIVLFAPDRVGTREYFLSQHKANPDPPIDPGYFRGVEIKEKDWKLVRNPEGERPARQPKGASAALRKPAPGRR